MSTPSLNPDDPRLTAYALGEADEVDRRAVEAFLTGSEEGRAAVERTREIAGVLAAEYAREHDLYLASRRDGEVPANIVPFSSGRSRHWPVTVVSVLKIAAVMALTASLVYLTVRRPSRSEAITVASAPAKVPERVVTLDGAVTDQVSKDGEFASQGRSRPDSPQASIAGDAYRESASASPSAGSSSDAASVVARNDQSDTDAVGMAGGRTSGTLAKTEAAPSPPTRAPRKSAPATAPAIAPAGAPAAVTAPLPAKPLASDEKIARSVVRIRTATGAFFGGVIVSDDGLILAIPALPESSLQAPCTVLLNGQREQSVTAKPAGSHPGWYWLTINGKGLPAVTPARKIPANDAAVVAFSVNPQTGTTTFPRVPPGDVAVPGRAARVQAAGSTQTVENATFAFNAAGELLVIDQTAERSKNRRGVAGAGERFARPFTDAEVETLQRAVRRETHE